MRKTIAIVAFAALAAGCTKEITAQEARDAMPRAEAIQIGTPQDTAQQALVLGAEGEAAVVAPAAVEPSEYARTSYFAALTVNGGAWWTLTLLRLIVEQPFLPPSCSDDVCTWGPWDENREGTQVPVKRWQLVVKKVEEGQFDYVLSAMNLVDPGPFLPIISGVAFPKDPFRGHGEFTISFENARLLPDPKDDYGLLTVRYDNEDLARVSAEFVDARSDEDGRLMNAAYDFQAGAAGGTLEIAFETREGAAQAISLRSRWDATGSGRGDARYHATDGSWSVTYGASECWDGAANGHALSWDTDPAYGAMDACADAFEGDPQYSDLAVP